MGQRMAAETPQAEHHQLAAGELAVRLLEFVGGGLTQRDQRAFRNPRIALGHLEWVAPAVDQLHTEREAALVDEAPRAVERDIIRLLTHRPGEAPGELVRAGRHREARRVEQALEQLGPAAQLVGEHWRMRKHGREQLGELRPRLEQTEEVHAARQPLDDIAEAVERVVRAGRSDRREESRKHRFEVVPRRAEGSCLARAPVRDMARRRFRIAEAEARQLALEDIRVIGKGAGRP